jgi:hypothetical protein
MGIAVPTASVATQTRPDFNSDGYADLAVVGSHYTTGADLPHWVVSVIYGSPQGLTAARNRLWRQLDFPERSGPRHLATDTAAGDFDGDGFTDLAIGTVPAGPELTPLQGAVRILYGSTTGLRRERSQYWTSSSPGLPAIDEPDDDSFGMSLVAANFGRSGEDDLAIGAKHRRNGGEVTLLYGSATGLTPQGSQLWSQATPGVPGRQRASDGFGTSLAAGRFAGSSHADLAVGVPGNGRKGHGAVNILYGSSSGLTAFGSQLWSQSSRGVKGKAAAEEQFGSSVTAGHFAGRSTADLAIGVRAATDAYKFGGAVNVLYGSRNGLSAKGDQLWTPRSKGLAGRRYLDTFFGDDLAAGNFGRDRRGKPFDDLALGAATDYYNDGAGGSMGAVEVLYGSANGLTAKGSQMWRWDTPGVKGNPNPEQESFGAVLIASDFGKASGGRAYADLALGDPIYESSGRTYGAVSVVHGTRSGLTARGDQLWTIQGLGRREPTFFAEWYDY